MFEDVHTAGEELAGAVVGRAGEALAGGDAVTVAAEAAARDAPELGVLAVAASEADVVGVQFDEARAVVVEFEQGSFRPAPRVELDADAPPQRLVLVGARAEAAAVVAVDAVGRLEEKARLRHVRRRQLQRRVASFVAGVHTHSVGESAARDLFLVGVRLAAEGARQTSRPRPQRRVADDAVSLRVRRQGHGGNGVVVLWPRQRPAARVALEHLPLLRRPHVRAVASAEDRAAVRLARHEARFPLHWLQHHGQRDAAPAPAEPLHPEALLAVDVHEQRIIITRPEGAQLRQTRLVRRVDDPVGFRVLYEPVVLRPSRPRLPQNPKQQQAPQHGVVPGTHCAVSSSRR
mmetsp:Transcript_2294/g.6823  ORF Transcript_2294/g.6823 Transcript_2294/m.6823 type:complete len:347 (+) Transcript_2294:1406-2446(+)